MSEEASRLKIVFVGHVDHENLRESGTRSLHSLKGLKRTAGRVFPPTLPRETV